MNTTKQHLPEIVAAIDPGTGCYHMIVARLDESGTLSTIDRLRKNEFYLKNHINYRCIVSFCL